uniref:Uncharacterized protein n=1 Tax=Mustela putorius furo TaxID=9669 RepID=M3XTZ6_MUSPF
MGPVWLVTVDAVVWLVTVDAVVWLVTVDAVVWLVTVDAVVWLVTVDAVSRCSRSKDQGCQVERSEVSRARTPAVSPVCWEKSHSKQSSTSPGGGLDGFPVPRG